MSANPFQPLSEAERDARVQRALRRGDASAEGIVPRLDREHAYLRWHGSPSEESRALEPMSVLLGIHLESLGWTWAEAKDGALVMLSPDAQRACLLVEVVSGLLERDDTNFSWFVRGLEAGSASSARGLVELA